MEYKAIDEFCNVSSSKRIFAEQYVDEGIPFYRQKEIIEKSLHQTIEDPIFIAEETYKNIKAKYGAPQNGDLLITAVGVTLGIPYVVDDEVFYFKDGNLIWLSKFDDSVNSKYLYLWFSTSFGHDSIYMRAIGSAQPAITIDIVKKYKLYLPDRRTQDKIVDVMSGYDQAIENNNKRIKILEQMARNLYKEWFVRLRFPGHEDVEIKNEIPTGWYRAPIADISIVNQRGISPEYDDDGEYSVINQKCIRSNVMDITESRRQSKHYKSELNLQDGDTVICSTGTGTLGRVGRVIGNYPKTTYDSHVTLVRAKDGISKQYLYGALKELQPWFMNMGIGSTNQQELYITTIRKATIIIPEETVMNEYERIAIKIHDEIGFLIAQNNYLSKQRDLLLPRLMNGKISFK